MLMRSFFLAPMCALLAVTASAAPAQPHMGPSVRDIVEFERIVQPSDQNNDLLREQVSPDGTQAFIVTRRSNVASDKSVYKIQLLDLMPAHLATQRAPNPVTIFSAELAQDNEFYNIQDVQWRGDRTLVFLGCLDGHSYQVYSLDVPKRELLQLTHEKDRIAAWAASQDARRVVYTVQLPNPPLHEGDHGILVGTQPFWSVTYGQHLPKVQVRKFQSFLVDVGSPQPPRALGQPYTPPTFTPPTMSISPDGRWALLPRYEPERLADWARRYPAIDALEKKFGWSAHVDPLQYFSKLAAVVPRRMMAVRLEDGKEQTIVDAPDDLYVPAWGQREDRLWQGTGASVVLAGTYLPPGEDGKTSPASHVIEYWPDSGRWVDIAALKDRVKVAHSLRDGFLVIDGSERREFHRQADGGWHESADGVEQPGRKPAWTLSVTQDLNQPPDVYASGPAGATTRLTWLNPQFKADTWGTMKPYTWRDGAGREWNGGLMMGSDMDSHTRHPLLIQTYGFAPDRFYLDGPNLSDWATSGFAGRAFLREGILVLAMPYNPKEGAAPEGHQALHVFNEGVRGAIDALVKEGKVDPTRVGIMGWSATGERVLNLIAFGDVPIRAATTADGDTNSLFALTITYGLVDRVWERLDKFNEGMPFGNTLAAWVRNDPSLHTDCIHTALRIEDYGAEVKLSWDIYGLLRRQYKPVEMLVLPGAGHSLLTPGDRMLSLQGNVDWHAFWLAGRTRATPEWQSETPESLAAQYARWRQMETLKAADDARPRCLR